MNELHAIEVKGLYKKFCRTLRSSMRYGVIDTSKGILGLPTNSHKLRKDEFWALENINFSLKKNESLGIIGLNGSGKTTLLRLLTGIFPPDNGTIEVRGKVASMIAVGAGFHPHMTGKENIYLNGSIIGMTNKEIKEKYDEIVAFAELEEFINSPVSTYSSGMYVRLGFAIAVHTEPDILLLDEILAVGDLSFINKAYRKMAELKKKSSTIFISHNMDQVHRMSDRVMLLNNGKIIMEGETKKVIEEYQKSIREKEMITLNKENAILSETVKTEYIDVLDYGLIDGNNNKTDRIQVGEDLIVFTDFVSNIDIEDFDYGIGVLNSKSENILYGSAFHSKVKFDKIFAGKRYRVYLKFKKCNLASGIYSINFGMRTLSSLEFLWWNRGITDDTKFTILANVKKPMIVEGFEEPGVYIELEKEFRIDDFKK
ncbi:MAG: ABC transporter ATP-binding protein [Bacteroidales bacterium]|jgi:lipopolysaccharide transport system ATP-binding protein